MQDQKSNVPVIYDTEQNVDNRIAAPEEFYALVEHNRFNPMLTRDFQSAKEIVLEYREKMLRIKFDENQVAPQSIAGHDLLVNVNDPTQVDRNWGAIAAPQSGPASEAVGQREEIDSMSQLQHRLTRQLAELRETGHFIKQSSEALRNGINSMRNSRLDISENLSKLGIED
jgi:hypothetical protein